MNKSTIWILLIVLTLFGFFQWVVAARLGVNFDCEEYPLYQETCNWIERNYDGSVPTTSMYETYRKTYLKYFNEDMAPISITEYAQKTFFQCSYVGSNCTFASNGEDSVFYDKETYLRIISVEGEMEYFVRAMNALQRLANSYEVFAQYPKEITSYVYDDCLISKIALKESLDAEVVMVYSSKCGNTATTTNIYDVKVGERKTGKTTYEPVYEKRTDVQVTHH